VSAAIVETAGNSGCRGKSRERAECHQSCQMTKWQKEVMACLKEALRAGNDAPSGGCVIEDGTERV